MGMGTVGRKMHLGISELVAFGQIYGIGLEGGLADLSASHPKSPLQGSGMHPGRAVGP